MWLGSAPAAGCHNICVWVTLASAMLLRADTVIREQSGPGVKIKSIAISPGSFTETHLEQVCRSELSKSPGSGFMQLLLFGERAGSPLPKPDHMNFQMWRRIHDDAASLPNELAEMISINGEAILRTRDASGRLTRKVLTQHDPFKIAIEGDAFEIVYLSVSTSAPFTLQRVDAYMRTTASLKPESGLDLLRELDQVFPGYEVSVFVKNDLWFINQPSYPFFNPFVEEPTPPAAGDRLTPTLQCGHWSGTPSCKSQ